MEGCTTEVMDTLVGKEVVVVSPALVTLAFTGVLRKTEAAFAVTHIYDYLYADSGKSTIMFRTVENVFISESCIIIVLPPDMVAD